MIDEKEAKFYALLDMCDNIAKKADTAISQLEATRATLEAAEGKRTSDFLEALQRLNESEASRKSEFEQWKSDHAQQWQELQSQTAQQWQKVQVEQWEAIQTQTAQQWHNWQNVRQREMLTSIEAFNTSAANIIEVLNQKVQAVSISQTKFDNLITKGTSEAITNAIGTSIKETLTSKFNNLEWELNSSQTKITAINQSIEDLKSNVSDSLETDIATKVEAGVSAGLTAGLDQAEAKIANSLIEIENASKRVAGNFSTSFDSTIATANQALTEASSSSVGKIKQAEKAVTEASEKTRAAVAGILSIANETIEKVQHYHDKLLNRKHWKWLIAWSVFITIFVVTASVITYRMNTISLDELAERKQKRAELDNEILDMQQKMQRSTTQYQDGKLYYSVDKSDCHDSFGKNFCVVK